MYKNYNINEILQKKITAKLPTTCYAIISMHIAIKRVEPETTLHGEVMPKLQDNNLGSSSRPIC